MICTLIITYLRTVIQDLIINISYKNKITIFFFAKKLIKNTIYVMKL